MSSARASKASSKIKAARSALKAAICSLSVAMRAVAAASSLAAFSRTCSDGTLNGVADGFSQSDERSGLRRRSGNQNLTILELSGPQVAGILERAFALPAEIVRDAKEAMSLAGTK
jgi:hypothetical protein